ncbi:MAG: isoprenylcysteine carboxylmethyltransferase family protein [Ignavibacteriales bacterium]|nr:isoprenylcysteine carboxylmethyltransferase family protein [Ignavibacteriales bacterium]
MSDDFAAKVFKYRSYTPLPFVALMILYAYPNVYSLLGGLLMVILGELIRLWGVSWAGSETRTTNDGVGSSYLVVSGPFSYVRNPLYLGNILIYVGVGFMSNAAFPYLQIAALLFFVWQYNVIVGAEEKFLKGKYGKDYDEFCANVPRFFPRFTPFVKGDVQQPKYNLKAGLKSESRTFQAIAAVMVTIFLLWFFRRLS